MAGALAAAGGPARAADETAVRYGYLPIATDLSFFTAVERGFFAARGLRVETVKFQSSNQAIEGLAAGRVDALGGVALQAALALETVTAGEFRIVEMAAATKDSRIHRFLVKPDSEIQELADLAGRNIGTFPGSQMQVFLRLILSRFFDPDQATFTQLRPPLQPQALITGQVDALFCLEPVGTQLELAGEARAISVNPLYDYIQKPFPTAVGLVATRFLAEHPEAGDAIAAALAEAHAFVRERRAEALAILPKYAPIAPEVAPHVAVYDYWGLGEVDRDAVQRLADLFAEHELLSRKVVTQPLYYGPSS